jgi:hypothetical protein
MEGQLTGATGAGAFRSQVRPVLALTLGFFEASCFGRE